MSPSLSAMLIAASGKSFNPLCTMASNTGCVSVSELLMTLSIPEVAVCCSSASLKSLVRWDSSFVLCCTSSKQPHVLDRDHRLVGEGGDEVDLLLREWLHLGAADGEAADGLVFSQQWNGSIGTTSSVRPPPSSTTALSGG
jgi:hypothetical protein